MISKELQERLDTVPDRFTVAWFRSEMEEIKKAYRGSSHAVNICIAEYAELWKRHDSLEEHYRSVQGQLDAANAVIGKLRAELVEMRERQDRMAEFLNDQRSRSNGRHSSVQG